jgi:ribonuclease P protein component
MLRLRSVTDFERVRREGRSHAHPLVVLLVCEQPQPAKPEAAPAQSAGDAPKVREPEFSRFGFAAGKGVGTAVVRNRAKRLLREAVRSHLPDIGAGWDLIFIARRSMVTATLHQTREAVKQLLQRAGVLKKTHA